MAHIDREEVRRVAALARLSVSAEEADRLDLLAGKGGVVDCGNSQNCVKVCPKDVPLTHAIAQAGRDTTIHKIKLWFGR